MCVRVLSRVWLFATPWTIAHQAPLSGSSIHGIFQARILGCIAIFYSRESFQPRDWTHVSCISCIGRWILYHWALQRFKHCHSPHLLAVLFLSGRLFLWAGRFGPAVASFHATYLTIPGKNVFFSITPTKRVHGIGLHHASIYETCCVTQIDQDCIMDANLEPESRANLNLTIRTKGWG